MELIFVDAENIGSKALLELEATILDKVFVFSNNDEVKTICEQLMYLCLSGYPQKSNQADFYIIAYLSKALSQLTKPSKSKVTFTLYSKDASLIEAFRFQCELVNANCSFPLLENVVEMPTNNEIDSVEKKVLKLLLKPITVNEIINQLNVTQADFSRIFTPLVKDGKVSRVSGDSRQWVLLAG